MKKPRMPPVLDTARLTLRLGGPDDVSGILDYFERNREFFRPTDPERLPEFYTSTFWLLQVERSLQEFYRETAVRFFLFDKGADDPGSEGRRVLGSANLTQIFRGPFQACYLGYSLEEKAQGQGLMNEALRAVLDYAFAELGLHRIMANYMPQNLKSAAVLKRLGFEIEGQARDYIRIGGEWRDHVLTSRINPDWRSP